MEKYDFENLNGVQWAHLLCEHPEFATECSWEKLEGVDWRMLLSECPEFADKCDWEKLDGVDWSMLLPEQPEFADKCDWEKLDDNDWSKLLVAMPQFAHNFRWGYVFDWWTRARLLARCPELADKYLKYLSNDDWYYLVYYQPQFKKNYYYKKSKVTEFIKLEWNATCGDLWRMKHCIYCIWSILLAEAYIFGKALFPTRVGKGK